MGERKQQYYSPEEIQQFTDAINPSTGEVIRVPPMGETHWDNKKRWFYILEQAGLKIPNPDEEELRHLNQQKLSENPTYTWDEFISDSAMQVRNNIMGDVCTWWFLQYIQREQGIDVQSGLEEIEFFDELYYGEEDIIRLKYKVDPGR